MNKYRLTLVLRGADGTLLAAPPGLPLGTATVSLGHVEQAGGYTLTIVESVETVSHSDI